MKKLEILTDTDVIYGRNSYLKNRLCVDNRDKDNGYIADLWSDCDHIKSHGEDGRGDTYFVKVENKSKIYIITDGELEHEEEEILRWWLAGSENEVEINNNWKDWDTVKKGIAYRGGSGYCYALYAMELK